MATNNIASDPRDLLLHLQSRPSNQWSKSRSSWPIHVSSCSSKSTSYSKALCGLYPFDIFPLWTIPSPMACYLVHVDHKVVICFIQMCLDAFATYLIVLQAIDASPETRCRIVSDANFIITAYFEYDPSPPFAEMSRQPSECVCSRYSPLFPLLFLASDDIVTGTLSVDASGRRSRPRARFLLKLPRNAASIGRRRGSLAI